MDGDSDDEYIPHPGTIARIQGFIADLDAYYASELLTLQAIELSLHDHLRYRRNIIADIKRLQDGKSEEAGSAVALVTSDAGISKLVAQRNKETEEIAELVAGMARVRASIMRSVHERTCLRAELAFAQGRF